MENHAHNEVRRVYDASHARLWRAVLGFSGSEQIADDAVAEAFAQVLRRGAAVRDVDAWVWRAAFAIARGELADRVRRTDLRSDELAAHDQPGFEAGVDTLLALASLSQRDRELLILCYYAGWKPAEVARIAGIPAVTVRVSLHRARVRARGLLDLEES